MYGVNDFQKYDNDTWCNMIDISHLFDRSDMQGSKKFSHYLNPKLLTKGNHSRMLTFYRGCKGCKSIHTM